MLFSPVPQPRTEIRYHPFTFHVTLLLSKPNPGWEAGPLSTQWLDTKSSHPNPYLYTALVGSQGVGGSSGAKQVSDRLKQISLLVLSENHHFREGPERVGEGWTVP